LIGFGVFYILCFIQNHPCPLDFKGLAKTEKDFRQTFFFLPGSTPINGDEDAGIFSYDGSQTVRNSALLLRTFISRPIALTIVCKSLIAPTWLPSL